MEIRNTKKGLTKEQASRYDDTHDRRLTVHFLETVKGKSDLTFGDESEVDIKHFILPYGCDVERISPSTWSLFIDKWASRIPNRKCKYWDKSEYYRCETSENSFYKRKNPYTHYDIDYVQILGNSSEILYYPSEYLQLFHDVTHFDQRIYKSWGRVKDSTFIGWLNIFSDTEVERWKFSGGQWSRVLDKSARL